MALDAIDNLKPPTAEWAAKIADQRAELLAELQTIEGQGMLF